MAFPAGLQRCFPIHAISTSPSMSARSSASISTGTQIPSSPPATLQPPPPSLLGLGFVVGRPTGDGRADGSARDLTEEEKKDHREVPFMASHDLFSLPPAKKKTSSLHPHKQQPPKVFKQSFNTNADAACLLRFFSDHLTSQSRRWCAVRKDE